MYCFIQRFNSVEEFKYAAQNTKELIFHGIEPSIYGEKFITKNEKLLFFPSC